MLDRIKSLLRLPFPRQVTRFAIADPRPLARDMPYTFHLPTPDEVAALGPGHIVKLMFAPSPDTSLEKSERMWVTILSRDGLSFEGRLENDPCEITGLMRGDNITFQAHHIIAAYWDDAADRARFDAGQDIWLLRARVDPRITDDGLPVRFIYREEPSELHDSIYPDTGWRLCADDRTDLDALKAPFVPIGEVLNCDDSFLELLTAAPGQAFERARDAAGFTPIRLHA